MQDVGRKMCGLKLYRRLAASKSSSSLSDARTRPLFFPAGFLPVAFAAAFLGVGLFEAAFFAGVFFRGGCSSALLTTFAVSAAVFCFLAALLGGSSCTRNPVSAGCCLSFIGTGYQVWTFHSINNQFVELNGGHHSWCLISRNKAMNQTPGRQDQSIISPHPALDIARRCSLDGEGDRGSEILSPGRVRGCFCIPR